MYLLLFVIYVFLLILKSWYYIWNILFVNFKCMFKKISTSYSLVKTSISFIMRDGELLVYSIFSLISSLIMLATFVWVWFLFLPEMNNWVNQTTWDEYTQEIIFILVSFVYYLVFSFITFFFNTAIITSVQRRIEWKDNMLWDWLKDSVKYIKQIFIWSLINAIVTTILNTLQRKFWENSFIWKFIFWLIWWLWNILTFFSFPLMILDNKSPKEAIKESSELFKKTWWERAIIHVWVWLIFWLLFILTFFIWIWIIYSGLVVTGIIFILLSIVVLVILSSTCDVIIKTILLSYSKTWEIPNWVENKELFNNIAY